MAQVDVWQPARIHAARLAPPELSRCLGVRAVKKRAAYHARIQKKWNKRYGLAPLEITDKYARLNHFVMDKQGRVILEPDLLAWAMQQGNNKAIAATAIGHYWVSTVFLGLDHGFMCRPLFFETMIFNQEKKEEGRLLGEDEGQRRYTTIDEARAGHADMVAMLEAELAGATPIRPARYS